jgi:uncharacterized protein (DUF2267 family)
MNGHHDFDHAAQEGNLWLRKLDDRLAPTQPGQSVLVLRASLHVLRDRLTPELAVHLSAQLPLVIRGLFFEGWKMSRTPTQVNNIDEFCEQVSAQLPGDFPLEVPLAIAAVFDVIWTEIDPGETAKVVDVLPHQLRALWPTIARRV